MLSGIAYFILTRAFIAVDGRQSLVAVAVGCDQKGKISVVLYALAILVALFVSSRLAGAIYVGVAAMWLVPARR